MKNIPKKYHSQVRKLIKEQYECYDFDEAEVYALENEIIENIIKSLSLTKESK